MQADTAAECAGQRRILICIDRNDIAVTRCEVEAVGIAADGCEVFEVCGLLHDVVAIAVCVGH